MKKTFLKQLFFALVIAFSFTSCEKDEALIDNSENAITTNLSKNSRLNEIDEKLADYVREYNGRFLEVNFIGRIINENNDPISGARVTLGNQVQVTDQNGIVSFIDVEVQENFAYARAFANGYIDGSRVMIPDVSVGSQNNFTIKLFKFNEVASFDADQGGRTRFDTEIGEGSITFRPGFTDEFGNQYHGDVAVSMNYLDPLNPDTANTMPGDLYGLTENFDQVALGSYGMLEVELRGSSGEKLQIIAPARLKMPIHPDQLATAASTVPMWSFNEHAGVWYEEAVAYKNGSHYVSDVPHFSFWNCDAPFPVIDFSATVIDAATLNPLSGLSVEITYNGFSRYGITNSSGIVSGKLPSNQPMTISIWDVCGNLVYSSALGPFATTTNITIPVTINPVQIFTLSGTVDDCIPAPVTNGYLTLTNGTTGQFIATISVTAGTYSYTGIGCVLPVNITITAVDFSTAQGSTTTTTVNPGANTQNISICGGLANEYIRYRINGGAWQYDLVQPNGGIRAGTYILAQATNSTSGTIIFSNTATLGTGYPFGTGTNSMFIERLGDIDGINQNATMALATPMTFDLVAVGALGAYISIDFNGNYVDNNGVQKTIQGESRIYRDY